MKFMELYRYLFYVAYLRQLKVRDKGDYPAHWTMAEIALIFFLNFITLLMVVKIFHGFDFLKIIAKMSDIAFMFLLCFPILALHYFLFLYKKKYKAILNEFKHKNVNNTTMLIGKIYSLGSLLCFLTVGASMIMLSYAQAN